MVSKSLCILGMMNEFKMMKELSEILQLVELNRTQGAIIKNNPQRAKQRAFQDKYRLNLNNLDFIKSKERKLIGASNQPDQNIKETLCFKAHNHTFCINLN